MKSGKKLIVAAVFGTLAATTTFPASSKELLRGLDPCIREKEDFRAEEIAVRNSLAKALEQAGKGEMPSQYLQAMWKYVEDVSRAEFDQYVWPLVSPLVSLTQEEVFERWFREQVEEQGGVDEFERAFAARYKELVKQDAEAIEQQVDQQKAALRESCPSDVFNSALRATLNSTVGVISRNIKAGEKEKTFVSKITRGTLGISTDDIREHGLAGGPNSEVRKAGRAVAKVFGW